ncbi:MAG TPA: T9SS type A sorting domain-containing protein [Bacteroidia bacterium]|jgi:hypothetical protein|nr:T9SS type A sorting domain-containing protein [Bacteroidia bacterium]
MKKLLLLLIAYSLSLTTSYGQGTWKTLTNLAPDYNLGVMVLLTDGTVMCLTCDSSGVILPNGNGNTWDLLTPDSNGSYLNGTWTQLPAMHDSRLFCSTWVLPDGNLYVGGGEYGSGYCRGEMFNTTTQTWKYNTGVPLGWQIFDGSSELLSDGTVLQGDLPGRDYQDADYDLIFTEGTGSYNYGPTMLGSHYEVSWVKLPDGSVMNIDYLSLNSERYIPKLKKWIKDSSLKNRVMDITTGEMGAGFLLPNGKLIFLSDTTYTAIYTPSGDTSKGTWTQGPAMPIAAGIPLGACDAPAAMMPNGNILCALSPAGTGNAPVYFYEFNYLTNTFSQVSAPGGGDTVNTPATTSTMLNLPDGTVLYALDDDNAYYQYTPSGSPIAKGKPVIDNIISSCPNFKITGKLFNGITEGAAYGDDWQMATNFPIVRLTKGTHVYYAKTTNWNRVGAVMTDSLEDTANFLIPPMPAGTYQVQVIANGNPSSPYNLTIGCSTLGVQNAIAENNEVSVSPNPSNGLFQFKYAIVSGQSSVEIYNVLGEKIYSSTLPQTPRGALNIDLSSQPSGVYMYRLLNEAGALIGSGKLVIQK